MEKLKKIRFLAMIKLFHYSKFLKKDKEIWLKGGRRKQTVFTLHVFKRKPNEQRTDYSGITATGLQEECECGTGFHFIIAFTEVADIVVKSSLLDFKSCETHFGAFLSVCKMFFWQKKNAPGEGQKQALIYCSVLVIGSWPLVPFCKFTLNSKSAERAEKDIQGKSF